MLNITKNQPIQLDAQKKYIALLLKKSSSNELNNDIKVSKTSQFN